MHHVTAAVSSEVAQDSSYATESSTRWKVLRDANFHLLQGCNEYHLFDQGFLGMLGPQQ
jgi:hypothetical protein